MVELETETTGARKLSTGSTLLNLAISNDPEWGFSAGRYFFIVGDSESGKTFLSMTLLAEAAIRDEFKDYRFIYDNGEDGMLMNVDQLFGEEVADRLEPPAIADDEPVFSDTIESFYYHLSDAIYKAGWDVAKRKPSDVKNPKPCIFILDSMDNLDSEHDDKKFDDGQRAFQRTMMTRRQVASAVAKRLAEPEKEQKVSGNYGTAKAKKNSEYLRKMLKGIRKTGSILIILSQTRADLSSGSKTRAGGLSLRFYATCEIWSSVVEKLTPQINGKKRQVGTRTRLQVRKNRVTGGHSSVEVDIYPDYGFDDIGSCIDYLVEEKWWPISKNTIHAKELDVSGTREKLIRHVESRGLESKLRRACGNCWHNIQKACSTNRKPKYA